jgi:hypothetical protein
MNKKSCATLKAYDNSEMNKVSYMMFYLKLHMYMILEHVRCLLFYESSDKYD